MDNVATRTPVPRNGAGGAPPGNLNAAKHHLHAAKRVMSRFGKRAINKRTRSGLEWKAIYEEFLAQATGIAASQLTRAKQRREIERTLSKSTVAEIEALATELWMIRRIDSSIHEAGSIVRKKDKTVIPLLAERSVRWSAYERRIATFRERCAPKPPSIQDLILSRKRAATGLSANDASAGLSGDE